MVSKTKATTVAAVEDKQAKATGSRISGLEQYQEERFKHDQKCQRCGGKWKSETPEGPDNCRWCNSPFWREKPKKLSASKSAIKRKASYSAVAIYVPDLLGLKRAATEAGAKSVAAFMEQVLIKQGVKRMTPEEYEAYKAERKAKGMRFIK
jgi:hypothetical protein